MTDYGYCKECNEYNQLIQVKIKSEKKIWICNKCFHKIINQIIEIPDKNDKKSNNF